MQQQQSSSHKHQNSSLNNNEVSKVTASKGYMGSNISTSKYGNLNPRYIMHMDMQLFNLGELLTTRSLGVENTPSHVLKWLLSAKLQVDYSQLKIRSYKAKADFKGLTVTRLNRQDPTIKFIASSSSSFSCNNSCRNSNNSIIMQIINTMVREIIQTLNSQSTQQ